jgi:hypothetical protein
MHDELIRLALRLTARISLVFFLCAFAGGALNRRRPVRVANWLAENQRGALLGLAGSHSFFVAIIAWSGIWAGIGSSARSTGALSFGGGLGYLAIYGVARCALLPGRAGWFGSRRFEIMASYRLWFVFALSYVGGSFQSPRYAPVGAAVLAALVIRLMPEPKLKPARTQ